MKRLIAIGFFSAALMLPTAGSAFADDPHIGGTTGQPSQSCQNPGSAFPGNTFNSPGSAFNGSAGSVYANPTSQGGTSSSGNLNVVAQYDVACFQQGSH